MTKYIHYKKSMIDSSAMISDNADEMTKGYELYIEIECDRLDDVLHSIRGHFPKFKPFTMDENGICNYSANTLKGHLVSLLASDKGNNTIPYKMKIRQDGRVLVYSRDVA